MENDKKTIKSLKKGDLVRRCRTDNLKTNAIYLNPFHDDIGIILSTDRVQEEDCLFVTWLKKDIQTMADELVYSLEYIPAYMVKRIAIKNDND